MPKFDKKKEIVGMLVGSVSSLYKRFIGIIKEEKMPIMEEMGKWMIYSYKLKI